MNSSWLVVKLSSIRVGTRVQCSLHAFHCDTNLASLALVLATGSKWSGPTDLPDSEADLRQFASQWREKFKAAEDIVVVGGGAVGVELSGEIRDEYPVRRASLDASCLGIQVRIQDKKITIVHGQDNLLNDTYPAKYRNYVKAGVAARNVDLVLGEYVVEFPPSGSGELLFKSGKKLNAGLVVSSSRRFRFTNSAGDERSPPRDRNQTPTSSDNPLDLKHLLKTS